LADLLKKLEDLKSKITFSQKEDRIFLKREFFVYELLKDFFQQKFPGKNF